MSVVALFVLSPAVAWAHSNSVDSDPRDDSSIPVLPRTATVTFNEPVSEAAFALTMPGGGVVKPTARIKDAVVTATLPAGGAKGHYVLAYRVVSEDGHPVTGEVEFTVTTGSASAATKPHESTQGAGSEGEAPGLSVPPWGVGVGAAALLVLAGLLVRAARR